MDFLPFETDKLSEATSINLVKQIQSELISVPFDPQAIPTTYVRQGKGEIPILLLHGFDSSLIEFRKLLPLLAPTTEIWAVDLLGFGFTERIEGLLFTAEQIKTHLYYFWKTLINRPVILVGASMGGATAIDFSLTYPQTVSKLVLIDSAGLVKPPILSKFMFAPLDSWSTAFLRYPNVRKNISRAAYYDKSLANEDAQICSALHLNCLGWSQALITFTKNGGYGSFARQLSQIQQPTLILWGENDRILGTQPATKFKQLIPHSQLIWIAECGHIPHLEKPQIVAQKIIDLLSVCE